MAQVIITNPPQPENATVTEGKATTFTCTAEEDGMPLTIAWRFTPIGSSASVALVNGSSLTGIEMVTVSDGLRTMLTFSGVRREADGATLVCVAIGSVFATSDPLVLTVQCELTVLATM